MATHRADHDIPLRKPNLQFDASIPRHWMNGNVFATHFFNGLNLVFPDGERFFVESYFRRDFHPNDGPDQLPLAHARLAEVMLALA